MSLSSSLTLPCFNSSFSLKKSGGLSKRSRFSSLSPRSLPPPIKFSGIFSNPGFPVHGASESNRVSVQCFAALNPELTSTLDKFVTSHKVVLFMKGTKDFPMCGFSNTVVQILKSLNVPFETFNILENELLRQGLKEYSNWPTFPQLYIDGEFFGGCDITVGKMPHSTKFESS
ncbi:hypothetical protein AMTR_s00016p00257320 [Amborella trichopoda]|uniref:Glutaredoxin domain-containing protein n=1 Tax=Amborella trichopoda TaxID=13333 RepID=W1PFL5_AMBTC|nr:hypothetical protein AMTR_s00016p00257320 [Amborella trichopoda]